MVAELIEQCVAGNDRVAPDQTEYRKKCDGLAGCRRLLFSLVFYGIFLQFAFSLGQNQKVYEKSKSTKAKSNCIKDRVYIDEGKSGTTTQKRAAYNRLFQDMETDKFDIIVIKSQDRLMRNTKEWYFFIDQLVQNKKRLYFYLDRKFYSPDDALITGIKAILAEDYSRSLSKNINNAHRKRQETGSNVVITSKTWGYDKINKAVTINEKEAEMVRFIYELAAQSYGSRTIAKMLQAYGYSNREGNKIAEQTVRRILRNPLYKGTALMNVLHKNFETKRTERNSKDKWIYHDHMVPAIVSEELWEKVNDLMDRRASAVVTEDFKTKVIGSKKHVTPLSGKIQCGLCGNVFWRSTSVTGKVPKVYWSCREYVQRGRKTKNAGNLNSGKMSAYDTAGGCDNIHIKEADLECLLDQFAQKIPVKPEAHIRESAMDILAQIIRDTPKTHKQEETLKKEQNKIKNSREVLVDKYLDGKIADDIYHMKDHKLQEQMHVLECELQLLRHKSEMVSDREKRMRALEHDVAAITDHDLGISNLKKHIEKIVVYPDYMLFYFDMFEAVRVEIEKINYRRKEFHICL